MELSVLGVSGVSRKRRPDLARYALMAGDRDDVGVADVVRAKQIDIAPARDRDRIAILLGSEASELALSATPSNIARRARMSRKERGVGEEVRDAVRGKR